MLYVIQEKSSGNVKIGSSSNPQQRLQILQIGNSDKLTLLAVLPGNQAEEYTLHEQLAPYRLTGEWFRPAPDLIAHLFRLVQESSGGFAQQAEKPPTIPCPAAVKSIYLAGKITKHGWRNTLVHTEQFYDTCPSGLYVDTEAKDKGVSDYLNKEWPVLAKAIFGMYDYTGPYFIGCDHGCFHGENAHGAGLGELSFKQGADDYDEMMAGFGSRKKTAQNCLRALERSDLVYAWLEAETCYGTLFELGYAKGLGKRVAVASNLPLDNLWFALECTSSLFDPEFTPVFGLEMSLHYFGQKLLKPLW